VISSIQQWIIDFRLELKPERLLTSLFTALVLGWSSSYRGGDRMNRETPMIILALTPVSIAAGMENRPCYFAFY